MPNLVPPADEFRQRPGSATPPPWVVPSAGLGVDLCVPDDEWEPDAASLEMLEEVAAHLPALHRAAEEHVLGVVNAARVGLSGETQAIALTCNAAENTVVLELYWPSDTYSLWSVTFGWRKGHFWPTGFAQQYWKAG